MAGDINGNKDDDKNVRVEGVKEELGLEGLGDEYFSQLRAYFEDGEGDDNLYFDFTDWTHKAVDFFNVQHLFTKISPRSMGEVFEGYDKEYSLYLAHQKQNYPPQVICDLDGVVNPHRNQLSLKVVQDDELIRTYVDEAPVDVQKRLLKALRQNSVAVPGLDEIDLPMILGSSMIFLMPIPKLRSLAILEKFPWKAFTDELVSWRCDKDPRLSITHKAHLLRGVKPRTNPHAITCTNSGTGKTTFYEHVGVCYGKTTPNAFLGYAKGPDEIILGTVHGCEVPYGIDQIESGSWGTMRFLFNAMEQGHDTVSSGGVSFRVECDCNFAILANPVGYATDPAKSFSNVLAHISWNPAIGRRFGIIAYGKKFKTIKPPADSTLEEWDKAISFFRAVEDHARSEIINIYDDPEVHEWIQQSIATYKEKIRELTSTITHDTVRTFLREHASAGQHRVKAAALNVAIVENLDKIALKTYDTHTLLDEAQEHLSTFIEINLESILNIIRGLEEALTHLAQTAFANLSQYQREIVSAIELHRRQGVQDPVFMLSSLSSYLPSDGTPYTYFSQCLSKLQKLDKNGSTFTKFNEKAQKYFNFSIKPVADDFEVFLNDTSPIEHIQPTGRLPVYPSSPFTLGEREGGQENNMPLASNEAKNPEIASNNTNHTPQKSMPVSQQKGKREKRVNGEIEDDIIKTLHNSGGELSINILQDKLRDDLGVILSEDDITQIVYADDRLWLRYGVVLLAQEGSK